MTISDIRPAENVKQIKELAALNKEEPKFRHNGVAHLKKNGELIYVNIESSLMAYHGFQAKLVLATDVSERVRKEMDNYQANLKIKESESNLKAIFESTNDGYILLDGEYRIKACNSRAREAIIFNKNELEFKTGASIFDYVENSRRAYFAGLLHKVFEGKTIAYDRKFGMNGSVTWIRYNMTPVYEDQKSIGICINGRDITVRKTYVQAIEDKNKILREISRAQSHLVRAPLARIMGLTALMRITTNNEDRADILNFLESSSNDLDTIIKEMVAKATQDDEEKP